MERWDREKQTTALWLIDVQEGLFSHIAENSLLLKKLQFAIQGAQLFQFPLIVTEQNPQKLGSTIQALKQYLPPNQLIHQKTTFSGYRDSKIKSYVQELSIDHYVLVGIESHVCVLQTAIDLSGASKQVTVLSDGIGSRIPFEHKNALEEMRAHALRVSTCESYFFDYLQDAASPLFKPFLALVKAFS